MRIVTIDGNSLTLDDVLAVARSLAGVELASSVTPRIERARAYIDQILLDDVAVYGTGIVAPSASVNSPRCAFPETTPEFCNGTWCAATAVAWGRLWGRKRPAP